MKLGHFEIFVADPAKARAFYEGVLGFEVTDVQGGQFVWLTNGAATFLLRPGRNVHSAGSYQETASALVLYTDNLDRAIAQLANRGVEFRGNDGSDTCPTFTDPDGNWFQLVNPNDH